MYLQILVCLIFYFNVQNTRQIVQVSVALIFFKIWYIHHLVKADAEIKLCAFMVVEGC